MPSPSDPGRLTLRARVPGTTFTVLDAGLRPVAQGVAPLELDLPGGVYRIRARLGGAEDSRLVAVVPGESGAVSIDGLEFAASGPVVGTTSSFESHGKLAEQLTEAVAAEDGPPSGAVVVLRNLRGVAPSALDHSRLSLRDSRGKQVAHWADESRWRQSEHGDAIGWAGRLAPGGYVLRVEAGSVPSEQGTGGATDQSIWLADGWQTLAFVPSSEAGADAGGVSVHMCRLTDLWLAYEDVNTALEAALAGLREARSAVPDDVVSLMLNTKFVNPMVGIVGAHALLLRDDVDHGLVRVVTDNLTRMVPGHPDVMALAAWLGLGGDPASLPAVSWPPMLASSYRRCLLPADTLNDDVLPTGSPAERIAPHMLAGGPWLRWISSTDVFQPSAEPEPRELLAPDVQPRRRGLLDAARERVVEAVRGPQMSPPPSPPSSPPPSPPSSPPPSPPRPTVPPPSTVSAAAMRRVREYVGDVAATLDLDPPAAARRLGPAELAVRVGMPESLVRAAWSELGYG